MKLSYSAIATGVITAIIAWWIVNRVLEPSTTPSANGAS